MRKAWQFCVLMLVWVVVLCGQAFAGATTTFTVSNLNDTGAGSLRQAITSANADASGSPIIIDATGVNGTISLATPLPAINQANAYTVDLNGPGADMLTVDLQGTSGSVLEVQSSGISIRDLTLTGGNATSGGGVFLNSPGNNILLRDLIITGNTAVSGGGVYGTGASTPYVIRDCLISENTATNGAGIYHTAGGLLEIIDSTVSDNTGDGVVIRDSNSPMNAISSTISGNSGNGLVNGPPGGGSSGNFSQIYNVTITDNAGIGFLNNEGAGNVTIQNSILAGNGTDCSATHAGTPGFTSGDYNLVGVADGCMITGGANDLLGTAGTPVNPGLGPLADNGGPTPTHALRPSSAAIGGGNPAGCKDAMAADITTDQRGNARVGTCDIGSFESQNASDGVFLTSLTVDSTTDAVDADPGDAVCETAGGDCTLRAAIQEANAAGGTITITLPAGTYTLSIAGGSENAAATGDLDITTAILLNGASATTTTIDGAGLDRAFEILAGGTGTEFSDLAITGGDADTGDGGGVFINGADDVLLDTVLIRDNSATNGGGVAVDGSAMNFAITESVLQGNTATSGGGLSVDGSDGLVTDTTIAENTATDGAGIHAFGGGSLELVRSGVISNMGEGLLAAGSGTSVEMENVTISSNTGGGLESTTSSDLMLRNVTIAENRGTGLTFDGGTLDMLNSIVGRNGANKRADCGGASTGGAGSAYTLIGNGDDCTFTSGTGDNWGTLVSPVNPLLGPLADNGGDTATHALRAGSPALDAGDPTGCEDLSAATLTEDQRAMTRPDTVNGICDVGAFESQDAGGGTDGDLTPPFFKKSGCEITGANGSGMGWAVGALPFAVLLLFGLERRRRYRVAAQI